MRPRFSNQNKAAKLPAKKISFCAAKAITALPTFAMRSELESHLIFFCMDGITSNK
jgi:hypothetical protein